MSYNRLSWNQRLSYGIARVLVNLFFMIFYGVRFYGSNNMPREGGVVVIANHQSYFDPPLIAAGLARRRLNFLARKGLFQFKPFALLIDHLDAIPLDNSGIGFAGIKESLKRLRNDEMILIFPEGERTWDGTVGDFLPLSLSLAQRAKTPILPVAITGCYEAFPRTQKFPRLWGKIKVIYDKPLSYEEIKDLSEEELRFLCEKKTVELYDSIR
ncbi:1-acyl-sn-glycerol-3-phosphate acyltransferase [Planctomycetales bacterium]|nr:1-acyl-sn-glycerol-3-phosphate acyltransferase [Planctomycetales bacterium]